MDLKDHLLEIVEFAPVLILRHQNRGSDITTKLVGNCQEAPLSESSSAKAKMS